MESNREDLSVMVLLDGKKQRLMQYSVSAIAGQDRPFRVVCDASDFAKC